MSAKRKKTKKIRKHHDPMKRIRRNTKGYIIESWDSWKEDDINQAKAWLKHPVLGKIPVGAKEWDRVNLMDRNWRVNVFVKCLAPDKVAYVEEAEMDAIGCKLNELEALYKKLKEECRNAVNPKHIQDIGWRAETLT